MTYYQLYNEDGTYKGLRGSIPSEDENLLWIENTPENASLLANCHKPILVNGVPTESASDSEINAEKTAEYLAKIQSMYQQMWLSSLSRATAKTGSKEELEAIREEYFDKYNVSLQVLNSLPITNQSLLDAMEDEMDRDFPGDAMKNTLEFINSTYGLSIPTTGTRFEMFCLLVIFKYETGEELWKKLKALCSYFRTACITDVEQLAFGKCDQRFALASSITNETTIEQIEVLVTQSKAL